ncbi:MAG: hypothetical protein ABEJ66_01280 [Candidatus Nanohaloarchaea archaeon]
MKSSGFQRQKGQSAIEYLMTYGWMLLVVAIVGGAIFATVQGQCSKNSSFPAGADVSVDSFAATDSNLQVVFRNDASEQLNITNVVIRTEDGTQVAQNSTSMILNVGETKLKTFGSIVSGDACNTYEVEVTYNRGEITGAETTGSITANMVQQ